MRTDNGTLTLHLDGERHDYPGRPETRSIRFVVHHLGSKPKTILVDGQEIDDVLWSEADGLLTVPVQWNGQPRTVTIESHAQ